MKVSRSDKGFKSKTRPKNKNRNKAANKPNPTVDKPNA